MSKPPFVMSKYMNKEDLYEDKAKYYLDRCEQLESIITELNGSLNNDARISQYTIDIIEEAVELIVEDK